MKNKNTVYGLGAALIENKSYIFVCNDDDAKHGTFTVRESEDGIIFKTTTSNAKIININGPSDDLSKCGSFHVTKDDEVYYLTYKIGDEKGLCIARSRNLIDWEKTELFGLNGGNGKIVSEYLYAGRNIMYGGGDAIRLYVSEDFESWSRAKKDLISAKNKDEELSIVEAQVVEDGVFVMYAKINKDVDGVVQYELHGALFDYGDPTKLLWQSDKVLYETKNTAHKKATLFGAVLFEEYFVSYWTNQDGEMFLIRHFYNHKSTSKVKSDDFNIEDEHSEEVREEPFELERSIENPIMAPQEHCPWESHATYNPTAIESDGVIHIIYRADGIDYKSVWGHASTLDGVTIDSRSKDCIYQRKNETVKINAPAPIIYASGGDSNGGCEDPRATLIDDVIYVTFTAFDGWASVRVAMTSIALSDFKKQRWNWKEAVLISPPGEMNKNWVVFPEKIGGKFAIVHSFYPNILIDYFDSLDELDGKTFINSNNTRPIDYSRGWDSWFRGIGPAPLKTEEGWLIFYHAMDHKNPDKYQLGAMLLDLEDPTKILHRTDKPILVPEKHYENEGHKWGVIYACGAVIKDGQIFLYYGGADKFVCVATKDLQQFLNELKGEQEVKMLIN